MILLRVLGLSMLLLSCLWNCSFAQPTKGEIETIRDTMSQLQEKLQALEAAESSTRSRVKDLGLPAARPEPQPTSRMMMRFYDLSDVFGAAPKYFARRPDDLVASGNDRVFQHDNTLSATGGMGGGGFGQFSIPSELPNSNTANLAATAPQSMSPAASVTLDSIVEVIEAMIESSEFAGKDHAIEQVGNGLLVYAPEPVQVQISDLFDLFRQQWGSLRTVAIEAHWIRADAKQVGELLNDPSSRQAQKEWGVGVVADSSWKDFFEQAATGDRVKYSAALSVHNGQTAFVRSGARPLYVSAAKPEVSEVDGVNGIPMLTYSIELSQLQMGSTLQVTASTSRGGNFVVLDLHNQINEFLTNPPADGAVQPKAESSEKEEPAADGDALIRSGVQGGGDKSSERAWLIQPPTPLAPRDLAAAVDRPNYETYQLSTTVRCPKDRFVLVGGMESVGGAHEGRNLYLFAKVAIYDVILDDARPKTPPTE